MLFVRLKIGSCADRNMGYTLTYLGELFILKASVYEQADTAT